MWLYIAKLREGCFKKKKMEKKKPAASLDFLKAQAIWFVGMEIWRFLHLTQIW
jgi:hypothetical protein